VAHILINELARESGIPSSALRYYERVGLLTPVGRSAGGYRVYDDRSVERLAFIARAKRLGLSLDEISDLVSLWDEGPCAPVQSRLHALVDDKVERLDAQIDELTKFRVQLAHVQRSLASTEPADRCGPGCGCDSEIPDARDVTVSLGRAAARQPTATVSAAPIACTLPEADWHERLRDWQAMFDLVEERRATPGGVALRFPGDADTLSSLARVAALEVACCSFFSFVLTLDANGAWLSVVAPPEARALVVELFGPVDD
jgi:DNA-binding transcriptional MerR regulator